MEPKEDSFHLGVKALIRNSQGRFLLLDRNQPHHSFWDIPGGRLQKGEELLEALKREINEEIGLENIENALFFATFLTKVRIPIPTGNVGLVLFIYLCEIENPSVVVLSQEHKDFGWFSPQEAANLLQPSYPSEFIERLGQLESSC